MKYIFLDRDDTLIYKQGIPFEDFIRSVKLKQGVIPALKKLRNAGFEFVMVSNQPELENEKIDTDKFRQQQETLVTLLKEKGIIFRKIFICPNAVIPYEECQKPNTMLVDDFIRKERIDKFHSYMIGDSESDVEFARDIGVMAIYLADKKNPQAVLTTRAWEEITNFIIQKEQGMVMQ